MATLPVSSLGQPISTARLWTDALVPRNGGGWMWIGQFYNYPNKNPTEWVVAYLDGGTYTIDTDQLWTAGQEGKYANQNYHIATQLLAPNNRVLFGAVATFWFYYDPTDQHVHEMPQLPKLAGENWHDDSIYDQVFNTDGSLLLAGTIALSGQTDKRPQAFSIDPVTLAVVQYGRVGSNGHTLPAFAYYVHCDGAGSDWFYVLVGEDIWDVVAVQISTQTSVVLATATQNAWALFVEEPEGLTVQLYTNYRLSNQTMTQFWVVDGVMYPFTPGYNPATLPFTHRSVTPYKNTLVNPPQINEQFCPQGILWRPFGSVGAWTTNLFSLTYIQPIAIETMVKLPDNSILGNVVQYQGFFRYYPPNAQATYLGTSVDVSSGINARTLARGNCYLSGYPNGPLYEYNPNADWDTNTNTNPKKLGSYSNGLTFSGVKTASQLAYGSQKQRMYMVGTRERSGFGAGIGYYDFVSKTFAGTFANLNLYIDDLGLAVFDGAGEANRVLLGGKTSDGSQAQLVVYDLSLNQIETQTPVAGLADTGFLYRTGESSVVLGISPGGLCLYRWDIVAKQLRGFVDVSKYGSVSTRIYQDTSTFLVTAILGTKLVYIDPITLAITEQGDIASLPLDGLVQNGQNVYVGQNTALGVITLVTPPPPPPTPPANFVNLPALAGNGSGTAVDVTGISVTKTITSTGSWSTPNAPPIVVVEFTNDPAAVDGWTTLYTFTAGVGAVTLNAASGFLRATVHNFSGGQAPIVNVGGDTDTIALAQPDVPAGNGTGATLDVSALANFRTVQVAKDFSGQLVLEGSNNGTTWSTIATFSAAGFVHFDGAVKFLRTRRTDVAPLTPGVPNVNLGFGNASSGGGTSTAGQTFVYTATGAEGATFTVTIPTAMASTSYAVVARDGGRADGKLAGPFVCPSSSYALGSFQCKASTAPAAGDKIIFELTTTTS